VWIRGGLIGGLAWVLLIVFFLIYCFNDYCLTCLACAVLPLIPGSPLLIVSILNLLVLFFVVGALIFEVFARVKETNRRFEILNKNLLIKKQHQRI